MNSKPQRVRVEQSFGQKWAAIIIGIPFCLVVLFCVIVSVI